MEEKKKRGYGQRQSMVVVLRAGRAACGWDRGRRPAVAADDVAARQAGGRASLSGAGSQAGPAARGGAAPDPARSTRAGCVWPRPPGGGQGSAPAAWTLARSAAKAEEESWKANKASDDHGLDDSLGFEKPGRLPVPLITRERVNQMRERRRTQPSTKIKKKFSKVGE